MVLALSLFRLMKYLKLFFGKDENWKKKNLDSKLFFIKLPSKTTQDYVSVRTLGSKSNSKPLFTYSKCLTMAVARTQRHYCNKCHLKRPKCICKKQ